MMECEVRPATGKRAGGRRWEAAAWYPGQDRATSPLICYVGSKRNAISYVAWRNAGAPGAWAPA